MLSCREYEDYLVIRHASHSTDKNSGSPLDEGEFEIGSLAIIEPTKTTRSKILMPRDREELGQSP